METIQVRFLGSGDAFGSGGRLQTCICIKATTSTFLVDCGASSLIALRRFGVAPNAIEMILLTHLHGNHFGGIPFFVLDAQLLSKRSRPLVIAGPPGTQRRVREAMEIFFPGSSQIQQRFREAGQVSSGFSDLDGPPGRASAETTDRDSPERGYAREA